MKHLILVIPGAKQHLLGLCSLASQLCHFHCYNKWRQKP